jgi:uncharacterized MAPEG superfamily protein
MTTELTYLAWAGILTALIRIPWMLNKVAVRGLAVVSRYPKESAPLSGWAHRLWVAHEDSVDNLVVFATLIVVLHLAGETTTLTAGAAAVYFWARLVHVVVYAFAIPWIKTVAHVAGFAALLVLAWKVLMVTL